jgi:glycogen operon protein
MLIQLRRSHPNFTRKKFFTGKPVHGSELPDITWYRPDGREMTRHDWYTTWVRSLAARLNGEAIDEIDNDGCPVRDDTFFILMNAYRRPVQFTLPDGERPLVWERVVDTSTGYAGCAGEPVSERTLLVPGHAMVVLCRPNLIRSGQGAIGSSVQRVESQPDDEAP